MSVGQTIKIQWHGKILPARITAIYKTHIQVVV